MVMINLHLQTYSRSLKQEGERARISLKALETLTYCCVDPDDLHEVGNKIQDIITFLKDRLPNCEGLIIRPELRSTIRKQARMQALKVCQKYRKLPLRSRRGPAAKSWRYRHRVGMKADRFRKVHILLCVYWICHCIVGCLSILYITSDLLIISK